MNVDIHTLEKHDNHYIHKNKRAVQRGDTNNGISLHVNTTMHSIKWEDARILEIENNWLKRKIKEALHIADNILLMSGLQVHSSWITCS